MIFAYFRVGVYLWGRCASLGKSPLGAYSSATQNLIAFPCGEICHGVYAMGAKYFCEGLECPNDTAWVEYTGRHRIEFNQGRCRSLELPVFDRAVVVHQCHVHSGLDDSNPEILSS